MAASRHGDPELAEELARYSVRYAGRGVHALGLTGNDTIAPAADFAKAFAIAREGGLTAAPHAGELSGPADVRSAVEDLGARRIAHGVRAAEDPAVLEFLAARGVSLDVCPTSNLLLGVVPSLADHPLPRLLEAGVRCSLGADDPLMFGVTVNDEYEVARVSMGLTDEQLAAIARTSLETSDAPAEVVATGLAGIDAWLQLPRDIG
jgi:adenosine deaminase